MNDDLSQWKDRSQTAATTALSIIQVALLRDMIDGGREKYKYYDLALTLLIICIILEFSSGLLLVTIYMLRSKIRKLGEISDYVMQKRKTGLIGKAVCANNNNMDDTDGPKLTYLNENNAHIVLSEALLEPKTNDHWYHKLSACCEPNLEDKLFSAYKSIYFLELKAGMELVKAKSDYGILSMRPLTDEEIQETNNLPEVSTVLRRYHALRKQGTLVLNSAFEIRKRKGFRQIITVQSTVTYTFYLLSILNIFVIVFGAPKS